MGNAQQFETKLFKTPVPGGVVALIASLGAGVCLAVFAFDLQLISEIDINSLVASFVLCGLGAGLAFILLYRLFPPKPPISLFEGAGVQIERPMPLETPAQTVQELPAVVEAQSGSQSLAVPGKDRAEKVSKYQTPENSPVFALISIVLMSAALSPRLPLGWAFLCLALLGGGALAFYWARWKSLGSNQLNYAIPVAGGAVVSAAMIGLGMVMMRYPFLRVFLELVLAAGAVIAIALHWLHGDSHIPVV
jgi:hypothetical protein